MEANAVDNGEFRAAIEMALQKAETDPQAFRSKYVKPDAEIIVEYPHKFISDTSDLKRKMPQVPLDGIECNIKKMGVAVSLCPVDGVALSKNLSQFDLLVYAGICTWINDGIGADRHAITREKRFFTPTMIYNCINPTNRKDLSPTSPEIQDVKASIDYMRTIITTLDYSGYFTANKKQIPADVRFRDYFINAAEVTVRVNGETVEGYELNAVPPMFWMGKTATKQITSYDLKLLKAATKDDSRTRDIKDNGSKDFLLLKHDLLTHIQVLKRNPKLIKKIDYDTLFERNGLNYNRVQKSRRRGQIRAFLNGLVKQGELKGWKEYKNGQKIQGIEFIL